MVLARKMSNANLSNWVIKYVVLSLSLAQLPSISLFNILSVADQVEGGEWIDGWIYAFIRLPTFICFET